MIHPTRTNLLLLKEKAGSVSNSISILQARKQALIKEFLNSTVPFLRSRNEIRNMYGKALDRLALSKGHEGRDIIESISLVTQRNLELTVTEKSIWGLRYKDITVKENPVRNADERGYDYLSTSTHVEECIYLFEKITASMLDLAEFENKLKRLGDEIQIVTRKIRMLEERILPELRQNIKSIDQYISERERESYYRLKKFKELKT